VDRAKVGASLPGVQLAVLDVDATVLAGLSPAGWSSLLTTPQEGEILSQATRQARGT
jgi:hypothetical protein